MNPRDGSSRERGSPGCRPIPRRPNEQALIRIDPQQIKQVLINLIQNSAESIGSGGSITLRARKDEIRLNDRMQEVVVLEVLDTGKGITPEIEKRLFDPFFTTKGVGEGTGLGLSIAHGIIQSHGGTITVESLLGTGTVFTVTLPILPTSSEGELFLTDPNASHDKACTTGRSSQDLFNDASMHVGCSKSSFDDMALE